MTNHPDPDRGVSEPSVEQRVAEIRAEPMTENERTIAEGHFQSDHGGAGKWGRFVLERYDALLARLEQAEREREGLREALVDIDDISDPDLYHEQMSDDLAAISRITREALAATAEEAK